MEIKKEDLFNYAFYDENNKLTYVLNIENLKKILQADEIILDEEE